MQISKFKVILGKIVNKTPSQQQKKLGMVAHTCHPSFMEVKVGGS
jgi:hypothetical protein